MSRAAILGNGKLTIGLNNGGLVHDCYYPYVGLDNLTTSRSTHHRIGVMIDGVFSWVSKETGWVCQVDLSSDAMIATSEMKNISLGICIRSSSFVDCDYDAFCRIFQIENIGEDKKDIKLFLHQVFEISNHGRADTALYVPDQHYILDYKGSCTLLINGAVGKERAPFDQYAVGSYSVEGKAGTFTDAEDGELSGNAVEHGGVDSVIRFSLSLDSGQTESVDYWIVAASSQYAAAKINEELKTRPVEERLNYNLIYWKSWLSIADEKIATLPGPTKKLVKQSLLTIKAHCDARGGIIASCDSSIYNYGRDYYSYVWPRDGSFAIWPLIRLGYYEEVKLFFNFCRDIITPEGYLMHKYQPDRAVGSTWHPLIHKNSSELAIQEDETASIIFMLGEFLDYSGDVDFVKTMYHSFVVPAANFLATYVDNQTGLPHASYDLWEEKFLTSTYTTACTYAALDAAIEISRKLSASQDTSLWQNAIDALENSAGVFVNPETGAYRKGFIISEEDSSLAFDDTLDASSFWGSMTFGYPSTYKNNVISTVETMEQLLGVQVDISGVSRYIGDNYFNASPGSNGNPWLVCTLWLAQFYIRTGNEYKAKKLIATVESASLPSGVMPEQIDPLNKTPISVTPLVWSHAEYINTILDFYTKFKH